jgi:hypothetical protein
MSAILPIPKIPISVRPATMEDLSFIDGLQKKNTKQVGFMPTKQFEGKIKLGHVLVAESDEATKARSDEGEDKDHRASAFPSVAPSLRRSVASPVGYLIGNDQYFKRDDVGIIYQINIAEGHRRGLIGAALLKAQFERSAWGCKLYCCWCAQDIQANYFWEAMGFVPLAFRTGSAAKSRVHIFWQKRIREGDQTTPWWFPSQTGGGSIREDRLVLPIPPGKHWSDEMPRILPQGQGQSPVARKALPGKNQTPKLQKPTSMLRQFGPPGAKVQPEPTPEPQAKKEKPKRQKVKNDPKLIAAARELRDRWLERVNDDPSLLVAQGKYDVTRMLTASQSATRAMPVLPSMAA